VPEDGGGTEGVGGETAVTTMVMTTVGAGQNHRRRPPSAAVFFACLSTIAKSRSSEKSSILDSSAVDLIHL